MFKTLLYNFPFAFFTLIFYKILSILITYSPSNITCLVYFFGLMYAKLPLTMLHTPVLGLPRVGRLGVDYCLQRDYCRFMKMYYK